MTQGRQSNRILSHHYKGKKQSQENEVGLEEKIKKKMSKACMILNLYGVR